MRIQNVFPSGRCHWDNFVFSMVDRSPIFCYYWDHLRSLNFLDEVGLNLTPPLSRCTQSKPYSIHAIRIPSSSDCIIFRVDINQMKIKFLTLCRISTCMQVAFCTKKKKEKKTRNQFILKWNPQVQPPPPLFGGFRCCMFVCYYMLLFCLIFENITSSIRKIWSSSTILYHCIWIIVPLHFNL